MKTSLRSPHSVLTGLAHASRGVATSEGSSGRPNALLVTVIGSVLMHGIAYTAVAAIEPPPPPAQPALPAVLAFSVIAPEPEPEPIPEAVEPEPPPEVVAAARPALRKAAAEPDATEPEDHELGEPDAPDEPDTASAEPPMQALSVEAEDGAGLAVATGTGARRGKASTTGNDQMNRAGTGRAAGGSAPSGAQKIDLKRLARDWMRSVSALVTKQAVRRYPQAARRARVQGDVWIVLEVNAQGQVTGAKISRSSGHASLDEAALAAIHGLETVPAPPGALHAYLRPLPMPIQFRLR